MMDKIGDCNVPGFFSISLKYIFCRLINPKPSRSVVHWRNSSPNFVKLSLPSSVLMVVLYMYNFVPDVYTLSFVCWDTFLFNLASRVDASLDQEDVLGFCQRILMGMLECLCIWCWWVSFCMNLLMCWCTFFCCSIVIRFCKCPANVMFPRSSYSSAYLLV